MKYIILSLTILEFTWLVIDGFMEENGLAPPPKKDISSPQYKKIFVVGVGEVYTMENKDTKTDYQELVRVGDQKWDMVKITIGIIFFVWDSYSLFFIYTGNFQVPAEQKLPPPKVPIPSQNPNLT